MRLSTKMALLLLFVPLVASAQYRDLDVALSNLTRGFGSGDPQAIVAVLAADHVFKNAPLFARLCAEAGLPQIQR